MFEASLVNDTARTARPYTVSLSAMLQVAVATFAATYPLWHIEALPFIPLRAPSRFHSVMQLVDPKPAQPRSSTRVISERKPALVFPLEKLVPRRAADSSAAAVSFDAPAIADTGFGDSDPVKSNFKFSASDGLREVQPPPKPPVHRPVEKAASATPQGPVRAGGMVKPPLLIHEVKPAYPHLAVSSRTQGTVKIEAIISLDGAVRDARVVSGHPLLVAAALDAVRQWRYRPTFLNDKPVEVALALEVHFTLAR